MADRPENLFNEISALARSEDYTEALNMLTTFEHNYPDAGDRAELLRAKIYFEMGHFDESIATLSQALVKWPDALALRYAQSYYLTDSRKWKEAMQVCDSLIADSLRLSDAYFLVDARVRSAWCSAQLGFMNEAREKLAKLNAADCTLTDRGPLTVEELRKHFGLE